VSSGMFALLTKAATIRQKPPMSKISTNSSGPKAFFNAAHGWRDELLHSLPRFLLGLAAVGTGRSACAASRIATIGFTSTNFGHLPR
jgi:hypothetical protein